MATDKVGDTSFATLAYVPVSVENPQHVGYEENQQYYAQSYPCTATIAPAAMPVVPSTTPQKQHQDDNQYQHEGLPFFSMVSP